MAKRITIITNYPDSSWLKIVDMALNKVGKLYIFSEEEAVEKIEEREFDLVLIDTSGIEGDVVTLVKHLRCLIDKVPIVVVTTSPTWRRAREIFLAGATDYVRRSSDEKKIVKICQDAWLRVPTLSTYPHEEGHDTTTHDFAG